MKRSIEEELKRWKDNPSKKPLIIRGARQVGKTYIVQKFGKEHFEDFVEVNFERDPKFCEIFQHLDPKQILSSLELACKKRIVPGKTLLF